MIQEEPIKSMDLSWSTRSQLKSAVVDGKKVTYLYDPFGRRVGKNFEDGTKEFYGYSREDIVSVYDADKNIVHTYLHGPGIDEPLIAMAHPVSERDKTLPGRSAGKKNIYVADYLGSVREVLEPNGKSVAQYDYEAFGKRKIKKETSNKLVSTAYAYTGREWDGETGNYYYRNRYYTFLTRKFISEDPIKFIGGLQFYKYTGNNPVNYFDPWGLVSLVTDISTGITTFDPRPEDLNGVLFTIQTRNEVDSTSRPGANAPFNTTDVHTVPDTNNPTAYGPPGTYIDTGDPRGRDIHGGGSCADNPLAPRQGWCPTYGCTRGQNVTVFNEGTQVFSV